MAYKHKHNGDVNVPKRYNQDPQLGQWVKNQRMRFRSGNVWQILTHLKAIRYGYKQSMRLVAAPGLDPI